jgi:hypothetical protein
MNKGRWLVAGIVAAVAISALDWLFNGILMRDLYVAFATIWRPYIEMTKLVPYGWASTLIASFFFVYIYHKGYEGKGSGLAEGLRFGLIVGLFMSIPTVVWTYVLFPIPLNIAGYWFLIGMAELLVAGGLVGLIYKPTA